MHRTKTNRTLATIYAGLGLSLLSIAGCDDQGNAPDQALRSASLDTDNAERMAPAVVFVSNNVMQATRDWTAGSKDVGLAEHLSSHASDLTFRNSDEGCPAGHTCITSLAEAARVVEANSDNCSVLVNVPNYTQYERLTGVGTTIDEQRPSSEIGPEPEDYVEDASGLQSSQSGWLEGPAVTYKARVYAKTSQHKGFTSPPLGASTFAATVLTPVCPSHPEYVPRLKLETSYYGKMRGYTRVKDSWGAERTEMRVHGVAATSIVDDHQDDPTVLVRQSVQLSKSTESNFTKDLLLDLVEIANQYALDEFDPLQDTNKSELISKAKNASVTLLNGLLYTVGVGTDDQTRTLRATKRYGFNDDEVLVQGRTYEIRQHAEYAVDIHAFGSWFDTAAVEVEIVNDFTLSGVIAFEDADREQIADIQPGAFIIAGSQPGIDVVPERGFPTLASTVREFMNFAKWPSCGDLREQLETELTTLSNKTHVQNQGGNVHAFALPKP